MPNAPRSLVTGVAGFIGSHLAEALVAAGHEVVGIDCFTANYPRRLKEQNLAGLRQQSGFILHEEDLSTADLGALLQGVSYVFHQAGQPGVRSSWGSNFQDYVHANLLVTQRLLEAARTVPLHRFVFASSSSIYGNVPDLPVREDTLPKPLSPYGVTKLAAEQLCRLYAKSAGIPTVSLRYFTVYGPRQRPDMAFHSFLQALLRDQEISVHGDGEQTRDFTFVEDVVRANLAAAQRDQPATEGGVYNIGGGAQVTLRAVIGLLEGLTGKRARIRHVPEPAGEVRHTWADCSRARSDLGFMPRVPLEEGLARQAAWAASHGEPLEARAA